MIDKLPLIVSPEARENHYVMNGLAQRAFRLANYDMTPDDAVNEAIRHGLIVVERSEIQAKIKRMPGNGSFA